jgi:hypothetical protein
MHVKHIVAIVVILLVSGLTFSRGSFGAIRVSSTQTTSGAGPSAGVRAQAVITDPTGVLGAKPGTDASVTAVAIIRITASIIIRDSLDINNGLTLVKHDLTAAQAYGLGQTNGYTDPPTTNPDGPWNGLMWPYRDQYDYFPAQFDPLGNDVGSPFDSQPGVYGFVNIAGVERGGPTDPVGPPGMSTPDWLLRGETGNGLNGPASYFDFDILPAEGTDPNRSVTMQIVGGFARVVVVDGQGNYSEVQVPIDDFSTTLQLPEPASIATFGMIAIASILKRRRR